ncbi:hypothetical protein RHMOL_Rhmol11G0011700 [Rhododendron molle]|uniref:Uncharacterized protein n=1 Tax=Rhododendron molle TaxID=49168 RepID=A0ACC0LNR3_RHOML|nr:hypothetical protein RHMOL_Rhmol11G0011700 [Rhododendron molle]
MDLRNKFHKQDLESPPTDAFVCLAAQEKIAIRSVLVRRNLIPSNLGNCPICSASSETPSHLLLLCTFAWNIYCDIFTWWNISWICPSSITSLIDFWFSNSFHNLEEICWNTTLYAGLWFIWKARNDLVFNNSIPTVEGVVDLIKLRVAFWVKGRCNLAIYSIEDFRSHLDGIRKHQI